MESQEFQPSIAKKYIDQKFVLQVSETVTLRLHFKKCRLVLYEFVVVSYLFLSLFVLSPWLSVALGAI